MARKITKAEAQWADQFLNAGLAAHRLSKANDPRAKQAFLDAARIMDKKPQPSTDEDSHGTDET